MLALPIGFVAAWWTRRSGERAADAALSAGRSQAGAALAAVHVQVRSEQEFRRQGVLAKASFDFLRAADALVATVRRLPSVDIDQRGAQLTEHGTAMESAFGALEVLASPELSSPAARLLDRCRSLERLALDRAVLRPAVEALECGWCDDETEDCDHPQHNAAWVAWCLLQDWPDKRYEERCGERDLLEFCLLESECLSGDEVVRILALADRCPASWSAMAGGLTRDPLIERVTSLRAEFLEAARSACSHLSVTGRAA